MAPRKLDDDDDYEWDDSIPDVPNFSCIECGAANASYVEGAKCINCCLELNKILTRPYRRRIYNHRVFELLKGK